jgi:L-threonylcarbamoyladenylate synthase
VSLTPEDATRLERCLAGDGVAVIPTDTVYGLACNPASETAMRLVYELKQRPPVKPTAVMFFSLAVALESLTELGPRTRAALDALLPGPVTLLLANPERRFPLACLPAPQGVCPSGCDPTATNSGLLGLRVPVLCGPLSALAAVHVPAAQSSANLSGAPDPRRLEDVPFELREGAELVLDGGELPGAASTVIDLSEYEQDGSWRIVRHGPLDEAAVAAMLA